MKRIFSSGMVLRASLVVALAGSLALAGPPPKRNLNGANGPEGLLGKPAPRLAFNAFSNKAAVDLADYQGRIVVVDFFICEDARDLTGFDDLIQLEHDYAKKGLSVIGVSMDVNTAPLVTLQQKKNIDWPFEYSGLGYGGDTAMRWHTSVQTGTGSYRSFWHMDYIVAPDGTIVWAGEPQELNAAVEKAMKEHPPILVDPRTMTAAKLSLDKVNAALTDKKLGDAFHARAKIPNETKNDEAFAAKLKDVDDKLQSAGEASLAEVDPLIADKKYGEAATKLKELATALDGTPMAGKAKGKLNELQKNPEAKSALQAAEKNAKADEMLQAAQKMQTDKKDVQAYTRFKLIVKDYPGTPAAATATDAITAYDADPEFKKKLAGSPPPPSAPAADAAPAPGDAPKADAPKADPARAKSLLNLANTYRDSGNTEKAREKYHDVITQFPGTPQADTAKAELAKLPQ